MNEKPIGQETGSPAAGNDVQFDKRGGVVWITINRPQVRNALRATDFQTLMEHVLKAGDELNVEMHEGGTLTLTPIRPRPSREERGVVSAPGKQWLSWPVP